MEVGCELMVFDISSTTNPVYVAGRDASGNATGTISQTMFEAVRVGNKLFIGKASDDTICSQIAGSAVGCELNVYDISSTTNPVYVQGYDTLGTRLGASTQSISNIASSDNALFLQNLVRELPVYNSKVLLRVVKYRFGA